MLWQHGLPVHTEDSLVLQVLQVALQPVQQVTHLLVEEAQGYDIHAVSSAHYYVSCYVCQYAGSEGVLFSQTH